MTFLLPRVIVGNRGDLLSRWAIMLAMQRFGYGDAVVWCHRDRDIPAGAFRQTPYGWLHNLIPTRTGLFALLSGKTVLWTGGLDIQDDSSLAKLLHHLLLFSFYRACGLKIVMLQQGAGPITTSFGRFLARALLRFVHFAVVRDSGSQRLIRDLHPALRVTLGHDAIFLPDLSGMFVGKDSDAFAGRLRHNLGDRPLIGINVRRWFHFSSSILPYRFSRSAYERRGQGDMEQLQSAFLHLVTRLRQETNARIVLLSMYEPGVEVWEDDLPHLRTLAEACRNDPEVILCDADLELPAFCQTIASLDLMIGMRLHSVLTALRAGVPALHIAYTSKGIDILNDLGLQEICLTIEEILQRPDLLPERAIAILRDAKMRDTINGAVRHAVEANADQLKSILQETA